VTFDNFSHTLALEFRAQEVRTKGYGSSATMIVFLLATVASFFPASSFAFIFPAIDKHLHAPFMRYRLTLSYANPETNVINSSGVHLKNEKKLAEVTAKTNNHHSPMRPSADWMTWDDIADQLVVSFGYTKTDVKMYHDELENDKELLLDIYKEMTLSRSFENGCNQMYMEGKIRGFMHLDNGQESITALISYALRKKDKKYSYYREHCHALASGVDPGAIMAELCMKEGGTCKGAGGSMHIFDKLCYFQGGWALVAEQLPYSAGAAKSILIDKILGLSDDENIEKKNIPPPEDDDRIAVVFVGDGGSQNGRMAELLNTASKDELPLLIVNIDNGRAINTFTADVAKNQFVYQAGNHYGVPGIYLNGADAIDVAKAGKAVIDFVRKRKGPAIIQVHTYRFMGHSPADPEDERGRKEEKFWARTEQDPITRFERKYLGNGMFTEKELKSAKKNAMAKVKKAIKFADNSPMPPVELADKLAYPDPINTDYNSCPPPEFAAEVNARTIGPDQMAALNEYMKKLYLKANSGEISICEAINLAIHEEMLRDPLTTIHAEDLQAGSSYGIPRMTQQTYGKIRAADEIIDEGHIIGKSIGEAMNGYRPIVELMNTNFGIYGMAEISSAGNTYLQTGGQYNIPLTIIGAGGTSPDQALGAEHSQPLHAYIMGIPGLKIGTAASPNAAYGLTKSMIRDNGPCFLVAPVKLMKETKGKLDIGKCLPLKSSIVHRASEKTVQEGKAVTVLKYLHGVKESLDSLQSIKEKGFDIDIVELRCLKPLDLATIKESLSRTNKLVILDESTKSGGVGATVSSAISEELFDLLDAPIRRLSMSDTPVPYASSMELGVVKRGADLIKSVVEIASGKY